MGEKAQEIGMKCDCLVLKKHSLICANFRLSMEAKISWTSCWSSSVQDSKKERFSTSAAIYPESLSAASLSLMAAAV
jgi:hypothetical protein